MKWKATQPGEQRVTKRWAFLPVRLSNGWMIWLERYYVTKQFCEARGGGRYRWLVLQKTEARPE